jgi:hypothetical protein
MAGAWLGCAEDAHPALAQVVEIEGEDISALVKEVNVLAKCDSKYVVSYKGCFLQNKNFWVRFAAQGGAAPRRPHSHAP